MGSDEGGRDRSSTEERNEVATPVAPAYDAPTPDDLQWFMELISEMTEQNGVSPATRRAERRSGPVTTTGARR